MSKSKYTAWKICLGSTSGKECGMSYMLLGDIRNDVNSHWFLGRGKHDPNLK